MQTADDGKLDHLPGLGRLHGAWVRRVLAERQIDPPSGSRRHSQSCSRKPILATAGISELGAILEVYFGWAEDTPGELAVARKIAREKRLAANRTLSCAACTASATSDANLVSAA